MCPLPIRDLKHIILNPIIVDGHRGQTKLGLAVIGHSFNI